MAKNIFDELPADDVVTSEVTTAAPANIFDEIPADAPIDAAEPMDEETYTSTFRTMIADKKVPVKDIITWSEAQGRTVKTPKEVQRYADKVRGGKLAPEGVRMEITGSEVKTPREAKEPGSWGESLVRQGRQGLTLEWGDELKAFTEAGGLLGDPFQGFDNGYVASLLRGDSKFDERYNESLAGEWDAMEGDWEHNPVASGAGYVGGTVASAFAPGGAAMQSGNWLSKGAKLAAVGATGAAVDTAGRSGPGRRLEGVPTAAGMGAVAGPVIGATAPIVVRGARMVADKTGITDAIDNAVPKVNAWAKKLGIDKMWDRIPTEIQALAQRARLKPADINRMQEAVQAFRRAGVEPRALDAMSRSEQDIIAAAGRKSNGPARDELYRQAEETAHTMGPRLKDQFERVTNVRGNSREMGERIAERRNLNADREMNAMRDTPLPLNESLINVMLTGVGKRALGHAMQAADPQTAQAMRQLPKLMRSLEPLGPTARARVLETEPSKFTIGMADRMRRSLNDMAEAARRRGDGGLAREITQLRDRIRGAASSADPNYREFLRKYGEDSETLKAIDLGAEAFDRNTDEFVPKAQALSDDPNAVINARDLTPSTGEYDIIQDFERYGQQSIVVRRRMPNGDYAEFNITVPESGDLATVSVHSNIDGRYRDYGDASAFNEFGPGMLDDAVRFFRENYGDRFPHIRGVTGSRVGGARRHAATQREEAIRQRQRDAEREARIEPEYDDAAYAASSSQSRSAGWGPEWGMNPESGVPRIWRNADEMEADLAREAADIGQLRGRTVEDYLSDEYSGDYAIPQEVRDRIAARVRDNEGMDRVVETANPIRPSAVEAYGTSQYEERLRRDYNEYIQRSDGQYDEYPRGLSYDEFASEVEDRFTTDMQEIAATRATPDDYAGSTNLEEGSANEPLRVDPNAARRGEAVGDDTTSNGLTFDELRQQYDEVVASYPDDQLPDFRTWVHDNFYEHEIPETMWERIRNAADRLRDDEAGVKRLPGVEGSYGEGPTTPATPRNDNADGPQFENARRLWAENPYHSGARVQTPQGPGEIFASGVNNAEEGVDATGRIIVRLESGEMVNLDASEVASVHFPRLGRGLRAIADDEAGTKRLPGFGDDTARYEAREIPPSAESLREPLDTPPGGGVRNTGNSTRYRNERPADLNRGNSFHAVRPREVDAPSDRQLAVGEMGRELERRTGETMRGPFEMGRRLAYAPEQQARNEALMGAETAGALQRAMDATMRQAGNTARVNPGAGSPTALRSQDDAALSEMMNFFGNVATGGKSGLFQGVLSVLRNAGMTEQQTERLVLRVMDPKQVDQVLQELSQAVGPQNAQQILSVLMAAQSRATGAAVAPGQPPTE